MKSYDPSGTRGIQNKFAYIFTTINAIIVKFF